MSSTRQSTTDAAKESFDKALEAIAHDMPLLMHGSGDVQPSDVHPDSVKLLSELTVNYISNLVHAAIDAHEVLCDGPVRLPPPPLPRDRAPKQPSPPEPATPSKPPSSGKQQKEKQDSKAAGRAKKRQKIHRPDCDFWDEPLPEPKIKGVSPSKPKKIVPKFEGVPVDEWCGVAGVDFWETSRSRKAHVAAPAAISTQCFIWPICHDVGLYGKVMDVQSARRSIAPLMVDNVLMDMVEAEGASLRPFTSKKRKKDKPNSSNADDDNVEPDEGDAERKDKATWPGLEYLLPVHVTKNLMLDLS